MNRSDYHHQREAFPSGIGSIMAGCHHWKENKYKGFANALEVALVRSVYISMHMIYGAL